MVQKGAGSGFSRKAKAMQESSSWSSVGILSSGRRAVGAGCQEVEDWAELAWCVWARGGEVVKL